ncbi:hypothetical protein JCM3766R1_006390 [Sporobolomyces carnicolor]
MIKLPSPLTSRRLVALPPTRLSFLSSSFSTSTRRASPTTTRASTSTSSSSSCPTCQAPRVEAGRGPTCRSCQSLLPPPRATSEIPNHYETLSPAGETTGTGTDSTPRYAVDLSHLKRQFLALQRLVHPDRFTQSGNDVDNAQEWAKVWSARVNDAWKTLSNDRERAEYLLSLHGVTIGEADPVTDPELLMSIMETRESLEEAESSDQVEQIRAENSREDFSTLPFVDDDDEERADNRL